MRPLVLRRTLSALALALLPWPERAHADPDEWLLGLETSGALYSGGAEPSLGGGAELQLSRGLTDMLWLGVAGGGTLVLDGPARGYALGQVTLLLDVFRTLPFVDLGLGVDVYGGRSSVLLRVGVGADYLLGRQLGLGVVFRYQPALTDPVEHLFVLGLRLSWRLED